MGRHRTAHEKVALGEQARALRAAGRSRREIQQVLGNGDDLAKAFLRGVPLPDSLARPRAKDAVREQAVLLRSQGLTYDEIAAELRVSKSSLSLWLRDLPRPESDPERAAAGQARRVAALRARLRRDRDARDEASRQMTDAAAQTLGPVTARDLASRWPSRTGARERSASRGTGIRWCGG